MNETLMQLDGIRLNFSTEGILFLNITLSFIMFGVALGVKTVHFKEVLIKPKLPIIGFIAQFVVLPAVTFLFVLLINRLITPTIAMGMILIAACPGGNISNFMSSLAKGNVALSVTLTTLASIAAILFTPLNFDIYGSLYNRILENGANVLIKPLEIQPNHMFQTVLILLGIPLILGMSFNHYFPKTTEKIYRPVQKISVLIFFILVGIMLFNNAEYFKKYIKFVFIIVLAHNIIALLTGSLFARIFKIRGGNRRTITIETGIQNSGLALVLLFNTKIFPVELNNGGMTLIAAWWGVWHIISGLAISGIWSKRTFKH